jgi:adenosylcobinamide-GDP ribazoletransferase
LKIYGVPAALVAAVIAAATGSYYRHRIGGVTGDCMGATTQLAEVAIYLLGAVLS